MAFNFNGNTPKVITYNGNDVKKLIYNGVTVWTKSNPVYWLQGASHGSGGTYGAGYPTQWTVTYEDVNCDHPEDCGIYEDLQIAGIECRSDEAWTVHAQATGSTGGNETMEIVVSDVLGYDPEEDGTITSYISINGYVINKRGTHIINVSGLSSVTMYAYLSNFEYCTTYFSIDSIRFY